VKIFGFGSFVVKKKKSRKGRNPQTGEPITITARKVLTFKPSILLKNVINQLAPADGQSYICHSTVPKNLS
jgi:integration host factor subunit alpha